MQGETNAPGYQVYEHNECVTEIARREGPSASVLAPNLSLPNGKIADLALVTRSRELHIYEVKTRWRHHLMLEAWEKYARFADYLWLVSLQLSPAEWEHFTAISSWPDPAQAMGVISFLGGHPRVYRAAQYNPGDPIGKLAVMRRLLCLAR